jgi:hypothetical protein
MEPTISSNAMSRHVVTGAIKIHLKATLSDGPVRLLLLANHWSGFSGLEQ